MSDDLQKRLDLLHRLLRAHPAGLSEYELIMALEAEHGADFSRDQLRDPLSLFQTHFLLFHALYRLRDQLWESRIARLDIHTLGIRLLPFKTAGAAQLAEHDPLRDYYLDLNHLNITQAGDVEKLLTQFWARFVGDDDRRQALATLELEDPVDWPAIKTQHRRLAMQHHPDRGGDEARLQAINVAMDILARDARSR
ncbi:MAG: DNA-J related domain-containing protein [Gammaproteobacteria bacterium]|nr:DNA-J related domain-containing protein [Gammaproteobacteria bacterium]